MTALLSGAASAQATVPMPMPVPTPSAARMTESDIKSFAALHVAITRVLDSVDAQLAEARNKTLPAQQNLRKTLQMRVADLITKSGLTEAEFERRRYLVSSDSATRKSFDTMLSGLTGAPLPGQAPPVPAIVLVPVPAGAAGVHVGHIVNAFGDTPGGVGLLPTAMTEARLAMQHATLAARAPTDLTAMKTHAGHVLHALDPSLIAMGPGKGYGVKRASAGIATHIELAAKAEGAPSNLVMNAPHIAAAARSTLTRADRIIALATQVQTATVAAEASSLVGQIVSLCEQLVTGADTNSDGRVSPDGDEGGLQQVQALLTGLRNP